MYHTLGFRQSKASVCNALLQNTQTISLPKLYSIVLLIKFIGSIKLNSELQFRSMTLSYRSHFKMQFKKRNMKKWVCLCYEEIVVYYEERRLQRIRAITT